MGQEEQLYYILKNGEINTVSIEEAFPFFENTKDEWEKPIVSVVGGGGKTTTMYALAETFLRQGRKVLVTTTTHIYCPEADCTNARTNHSWKYSSVYARNLQEVELAWSMNRIPVIGEKGRTTKLSMPETDFLRAAMKIADAVVIEADGAKCLPCKVPRENEPVILPESNIVVGVMGMDALGQPAKEVCFRLESAGAWLGFEEEHLISAEDLARILTSEQGTRKAVKDRAYYVVLNKCDTEARLQEAADVEKYIRSFLNREKVSQIVCSCYKASGRRI